MANLITRRRESEEIAELAYNAYPTAGRPARALPEYCETFCRHCKHNIERGYYTSGPYAGESLHVCDIDELMEPEPGLWCDRFEWRDT